MDKNERGYAKVERAVLQLRRSGYIAYGEIVDGTRWRRSVRTFDSLADALESTRDLYRRDLWTGSPVRLEVWAESDSIAGTVADVCREWAVDLMVTRGYSSETFAFEAAAEWARDDREPVVLYVGDLDPAGIEMESNLWTKLGTFAGVVPRWRRVGITWQQVVDHDLWGAGTQPKTRSGSPTFRDPFGTELDRAFEAEALPAEVLRAELAEAIEGYVDLDRHAALLAAEESERRSLARLAATFAGGAA